MIRWAFAFLLLAATYNPTQWNFVRWAIGNYQNMLSVTVLVGLILAIGYIILLRATLRSIGMFGMLLVLAIAGTLLWVLFDQGFINLTNPTINTWLGIIILGSWKANCVLSSALASQIRSFHI